MPDKQMVLDLQSFLKAAFGLHEALEAKKSYTLDPEQAKALSTVVYLMLQKWAYLKAEKYVAAFSSDPKQFIDMYTRIKGGATILGVDDVQFFVTEYDQLVDIISLAQNGKTSLELLKETYGDQFGE